MKSLISKPIIAITQGDPAGIGPEIAAKAARHPRVRAVCEPVILRMRSAPSVRLGRPSPMGGRLSFDALVRAAELANRGWVDGIVTAPIDKKSWGLAGVRYPGHTEALAALAGVKRYAMMFADRAMFVTLVTRHISLASVSSRLTREKVAEAVELTVQALRRHFGKAKPRVTVLGLNPHGGRDNLFGKEERRVIEPALRRLRRLPAVLTGPLPPDSAFRPAVRRQTDAYVAMYHDQGLIPFKMLAFERGVNVTLGLPFVRTSPDHGTAYDLAGKNRADPTSMIEAVLLAARMAR